jgi:putative RecB family exonuclease
VRLSYSKLATYRQCPLRYRFTYLDRLPRRPRRLFRAARRIHHALMRWLTYARSGPPQWDEVRAAYDSAWGVLQDPTLTDTPDYQEGLRILQAYHAANAERPCQPVLLEQKFAVPVGQHVLVGAIDRVDAGDSGYEVVDYKLDREVRSQEEVDEDLQLGLYHVAVEQAYGFTPDALTLYFLRHNVQRTTHRSREQVAELSDWVLRTGDRIEGEGHWEPCHGSHCTHCDFRSVCPIHTGGELPPLPERPRRSQGQMTLLLADGSPTTPAARPSAHDDALRQLALPLAP